MKVRKVNHKNIKNGYYGVIRIWTSLIFPLPILP